MEERKVSVIHSCLTLCDATACGPSVAHQKSENQSASHSVVSSSSPPMDCSPPGSSVHATLQARILEWVAISFSRGSSWSRDRTWVSCISCIGRQILYCWATCEVLPIGYTTLLETLANLFILILYLNSADPRPQESSTVFWPLYVYMPLCTLFSLPAVTFLSSMPGKTLVILQVQIKCHVLSEAFPRAYSILFKPGQVT